MYATYFPVSMLYIIIVFLASSMTIMLDCLEVITDDVHVSYRGTMSVICDDAENRFQIFTSTQLPDCVIECALREHCLVMNYKLGMNLCELYHLDELSSNASDNCFRVEKKDINVTKSPCEGSPCSPNTVCDRSTRTCKTKECLVVPKITNGRVLGNLRSVGSRIKFVCNHGFNSTNISNNVAVCRENGSWSTEGVCVANDLFESPIGELCSASNSRCAHYSLRCAYKRDNEYVCHCQFGYEFEQTLGICVKVCSAYSNDSSEFIPKPGSGIALYNLAASIQWSFDGCVKYCTENEPFYLSIEMADDGSCICQTISMQQFISAYGKQDVEYEGWVFYDRPCAVIVV